MDIGSIKRRLLVKYPSFGSVTANLKYVESKECETAETDGESIYYNPDFLNSLPEDKQTFLFAHEVCHVAFNHIFRSEGKDKRLWNIATDAVINALLQEDGLEIIEGGVDIPDAVNYASEEMYKKLLAEKEQKNESNQGNGQNEKSENGSKGGYQSGNSNKSNEDKGEENQNVGHDNHNLWEKAIENRKKQNKEEKQEDESSSKAKSGLLDKLFNKNKENKPEEKKEKTREEIEAEKQKEDRIKKIAEEGEKKSFKQNKIDRKKQLEELRETLAKQSIGAGEGTNSVDRVVKEIGVAEPLVDWRKMLKEAVNAKIDWSYKNASVEDGVITPHIEELPQPETEILLDTSGSIQETLLRNFLRECKNILQSSKVKVGCFDTKFYGFEEIRSVKDIENMRFKGGGGTNFDVAVNAFSRRVENKIIFTDGEAPMPEKSLDAIWIVFGEEKIKPKGGRVININSKQLERLYRYTDINR